ncbi:MAG: hypothetical protein Q8K65_07355 [Alphaproteobacteria bacterium]|nr:hypothetical protein [Alphaproteobacteria bacterium]
MINKSNIALIGLVFILSGCAGDGQKEAGDTSRHYQAISVVTPGVTGAHCFLQAGSMSYTTAANSRVMVRRAPEAMDVSCFKGAHMVGHTSVKPTVAPREAERILGSSRDCDSCVYPESVHVVLAIRPQSVEKNNIRIMQ